jgi:hypothetical protein
VSWNSLGIFLFVGYGLKASNRAAMLSALRRGLRTAEAAAPDLLASPLRAVNDWLGGIGGGQSVSAAVSALSARLRAIRVGAAGGVKRTIASDLGVATPSPSPQLPSGSGIEMARMSAIEMTRLSVSDRNMII